MIKKLFYLFTAFLLVFSAGSTVLAQEEQPVTVEIPYEVKNVKANIRVEQISGEESISAFEEKDCLDSGTITFSLKEIGNYEFKAYLTNVSNDDAKYDKTVWNIKVGLFTNEAGTEKTVSTAISKGDSTEKSGKLIFENEKIYHETKISFILNNSSGSSLSGAKLLLKNKTGATVATWISGNSVYTVGLLPGTYILSETDVPSGYTKFEDVEFTVNEDGSVSLVKYDKAVVSFANNTFTITQPAESTPSPTPTPTVKPSDNSAKNTPTPTNTPAGSNSNINTGSSYAGITLVGIMIGAIILLTTLVLKPKHSVK